MGKGQRACCVCGASVGFIERERCWCTRRFRVLAAKAPCPGCRAGPHTERRHQPVRAVLAALHPLRRPGPGARGDTVPTLPVSGSRRCGQSALPALRQAGFLRAETGWCGSCSRPGPPKDPPRTCQVCGQLRRHQGLGMCSRCFQRDPDRPFVRGEHLIAELEQPPPWLAEFVAFLAARYAPGRAAALIGSLDRLLRDEHPNHPPALLERARRPGRSIGPLARALKQFSPSGALRCPPTTSSGWPPAAASAGSTPPPPSCVRPSRLSRTP